MTEILFRRVGLVGVMALGLVWAAGLLPASLRAEPRAMSLEDLGREVCRGQPELCATTWAAEDAQGRSFNVMIYQTCHLVWNRWGDHEGIDCVERAILASARLSNEDLMHGQFQPGEREAHPVWSGSPDAVWADRIKSMISRVPGFCDRHTPVIYTYFACIAHEVLNLTIRLKRIS